EVARGALLMSKSKAFPKQDFDQIKSWFPDYLKWLNTHPYGTDERAAANNHSVCWAMQAAAFAQSVGDQQQLAAVREPPKKTSEDVRTVPLRFPLLWVDENCVSARFPARARQRVRSSLAQGISIATLSSSQARTESSPVGAAPLARMPKGRRSTPMPFTRASL